MNPSDFTFDHIIPQPEMTEEQLERHAKRCYDQGWPYLGEAALAKTCIFLKRALDQALDTYADHFKDEMVPSKDGCEELWKYMAGGSYRK